MTEIRLNFANLRPPQNGLYRKTKTRYSRNFCTIWQLKSRSFQNYTFDTPETSPDREIGLKDWQNMSFFGKIGKSGKIGIRLSKPKYQAFNAILFIKCKLYPNCIEKYWFLTILEPFSFYRVLTIKNGYFWQGRHWEVTWPCWGKAS